MMAHQDAEVIELPIIDLQVFLNEPESEAAQLECQKVTLSLVEYGVLALRDARVSEQYNSQFIDMMEQYFEQPYETKLLDARPEVHYQVGVTPGLVEDPKCKVDVDCQKLIEKLSPENKPLVSAGPDPKWRFFWRMGKVPKKTSFVDLNASPVLPKGFPAWESTMNLWGNLMKTAVSSLSEMLAVGLGLPRRTFTDMAEYGPHLLAPTGSDLGEYGVLDTVLAGFHYDLNFLTIHGKSRFPGLNVWAKNNAHKVGVKIPEGCLLVQAGKQVEWLTGGKIKAGYHEVVVNSKTIEAMQKAKSENRSLWRVSSTFFMHMGSDTILKPLTISPDDKHFDSIMTKYPATPCGQYVQNELSHIKLKADSV